MAYVQYIVLLHRDVPRAAQFYAHGLGLAVKLCHTRWAELQSGVNKICIMEAPSDDHLSKAYKPFLSYVVKDMDSTVSRFLSMGAQLHRPIRLNSNPDCKVAEVRCLDGHVVGLVEPIK